jgi:hypothetical protein
MARIKKGDPSSRPKRTPAAVKSAAGKRPLSAAADDSPAWPPREHLESLGFKVARGAPTSEVLASAHNHVVVVRLADGSEFTFSRSRPPRPDPNVPLPIGDFRPSFPEVCVDAFRHYLDGMLTHFDDPARRTRIGLIRAHLAPRLEAEGVQPMPHAHVPTSDALETFYWNVRTFVEAADQGRLTQTDVRYRLRVILSLMNQIVADPRCATT